MKSTLPGGGRVLSVAEVTLDERPAVCIEQIAEQAVEQRREARDRRRQHDTAWAQDASRLTQSVIRVLGFQQVIERAEQQHSVERAVLLLEVTSVTDDGLESAGGDLQGLLDVERGRIDEAHVVSRLGEPRGVHARPAADVEHAAGGGGRWRSSSSHVRANSIREYPCCSRSRSSPAS